MFLVPLELNPSDITATTATHICDMQCRINSRDIRIKESDSHIFVQFSQLYLIILETVQFTGDLELL